MFIFEGFAGARRKFLWHQRTNRVPALAPVARRVIACLEGRVWRPLQARKSCVINMCKCGVSFFFTLAKHLGFGSEPLDLTLKGLVLCYTRGCQPKFLSSLPENACF